MTLTLQEKNIYFNSTCSETTWRPVAPEPQGQSKKSEVNLGKVIIQE